MEPLSATIQQNLLTLLAYSEKSGRIISKRLDPALCEGEHRLIAELLINYWRQWDAPPGIAHTADLFSDILDDKNNRRAPTFRRILTFMRELWEQGINEGYVLDRFDISTEAQLLKDAVLRSAEQLQASQELAVPEIHRIWNEMLRYRKIEFHAGTTLVDVDSLFDFLESQYSEFPTGIPALDKREIGPSRGSAFLVIAPTGYGKSWFLIHLGKMAMNLRKKVLHVTLEMAEEEVKQRYFQNIFTISKREKEVPITTLEVESGELTGLGTEEITPEFTFHSRYVREDIETRVHLMAGKLQNVRIKQFPTSALTVEMLDAFLDNLEVTHKFIPDILILDYIKLMKTDAKNLRVSLGRTFEELRGLAIRRNLALVTAAQGNRTSMGAEWVRASHTAEDISLVQSADVAITYSQKPEEKKRGLARLYVDKFRHDEDKFGILLTQSYRLGQFVLNSMELEPAYWDYLKEDEVADDEPEEEEDDE